MRKLTCYRSVADLLAEGARASFTAGRRADLLSDFAIVIEDRIRKVIQLLSKDSAIRSGHVAQAPAPNRKDMTNLRRSVHQRVEAPKHTPPVDELDG